MHFFLLYSHFCFLISVTFLFLVRAVHAVFFISFPPIMFIIMHQYTKAKPSYMSSYFAINRILIPRFFVTHTWSVSKHTCLCVEHEPEEEVWLLSETKQ